MGDRTAIEWSDATWNPVLGCSHVSAGCDNCYAARQAVGRLRNVEVYAGLAAYSPGRGPRFTGVIRTVPDRLDQPLRWRRPRRVFVNSMSDLFHPDIPEAFMADVFAVMSLAGHHQFQVLTKRPQLMPGLVGGLANAVAAARDKWAGSDLQLDTWPLRNVWLGTSIETDRYTFRADHLRGTPAAVRFLSLEPLLGPLPSLDLEGIDWVIVGGESGPGARPMHPDWVRDIRDRCVAAGVPFHFKQWGEYVPVDIEDDETFAGGRAYDDPRGGRRSATFRLRSRQPFQAGKQRLMRPGEQRQSGDTLLDYETMAIKVGKRAAGRTLDGRTWDEFPDG